MSPSDTSSARPLVTDGPLPDGRRWRGRVSRIEVTHLQDYIVVVESGSLSRAAARLHVSQPAVGQRISQLEAALDVRLLQRGPRGVSPTPSGRALYREAHHLVAQFDRLSSNIQERAHGVSGTVSLGVPATVAQRLAPRLVAHVQERLPGIQLQIFESTSAYIQELLSLGRLDLAVLYRPFSRRTDDAIDMYFEEMALIGPLPSDGGVSGDITVEELQDVRLVLPARHSSLRSIVEDAFAAHQLQPHVVADVDSVGALMSIAESGVASTILPPSVVPSGTDHHATAVRRIRAPAIQRFVTIHSPACVERDAVVEIRQAVLAVVADLAGTSAWPGSCPTSAQASLLAPRS